MTLAVTLTVEELEALMERAAARALAAHAPVTDEADEVLTREQAAKLLQVTPHQVGALVKRNGLPGHRLGKTQWRFRRREVLAWIDRQTGEKR